MVAPPEAQMAARERQRPQSGEGDETISDVGGTMLAGDSELVAMAMRHQSTGRNEIRRAFRRHPQQ